MTGDMLWLIVAMPGYCHMHASLRPKHNLGLIALWAVAAAAFAYTTIPRPWTLMGIGAVLGAIAGTVQAAAARASTDTLLSTQTAMDVRRVLRMSAPGRLYLQILWLSVAAMLAVAYWMDASQVLILWMAGYAAFGMARELMTVPCTFRLGRIEQERRDQQRVANPD